MPSRKEKKPRAIWEPDPRYNWMNETLANPESLYWTTEQRLWYKLDSMARTPGGRGAGNKLTILWGLGILNPGPTQKPIHSSNTILRARTPDGRNYMTSTKDYSNDIKSLCREGLIVAYESEPARHSDKSLWLVLGNGSSPATIPHTILDWSVCQGYVSELFIGAVENVIQEPLRDTDRLIYSLWNLYQTIQNKMLKLQPPNRFRSVRRIAYVKLLFRYASEVPPKTAKPLLAMIDDLLAELKAMVHEYPSVFRPLPEEVRRNIIKELPRLHMKRAELVTRLGVAEI